MNRDVQGSINLFLAGIGEDGHIAFSESGSSLASRTFDNDVNQVPKMALTVGMDCVGYAWAGHHCTKKKKRKSNRDAEVRRGRMNHVEATSYPVFGDGSHQ